jgi:hypothetical protein
VKGRAILLAGLVVALSAGVTACGGDGDEGDETFQEEGFEISFSYPADFELSTDVTADVQAGEEADARAGVGLDDENGILVSRYDLNLAVTSANLPEARPQVDALVSQVAGRNTQSEETEVGGLPALSYPPFPVESTEVTNRFIIVFDGDVQYQFNCQWTDEHMAEVQDACDLALSTLKQSG